MTTKVWKYFLPRDENKPQLQMPAGAKILSIQLQVRDVVLWVQVPAFEVKKGKYQIRQFRFATTGELIEIDNSMLQYIGTVQGPDFDFTVHVFEIILQRKATL